MTERRYRAAILDMDGVLTNTATLHARAWKELFDRFLEERGARRGEDHAPFDVGRDYLPYVDGKPRLDGIRSFLRSRGIVVPDGGEGDPASADTVHGLGARKNAIFHGLLEREGVETFPDTVEQVLRWRAESMAVALITSSRNGRMMLRRAKLEGLFDVILDGNDAARLGLAGKPAPDIFLRAARELGVSPSDAIVVEDAIAGVEAARAGRFGLVVGVDRGGGAVGLRAAGADVVVTDVRAAERPFGGSTSESAARG